MNRTYALPAVSVRPSGSVLRSSFNNGLRALFLFTLVLIATPAMAQFTSGDWRYSLNANIVTITRYTGTSSNASIPSKISGYPVEFLDIAAFAGNTTLTNVFVSSSIIGVLNGAGVVPFDTCINLLSIMVDPLNLVFSSVGGVLFNKNQTSLLEYPNGRSGSYAIQAGVGRIAPYAFDSCINLTSVTIPNTVTNIMAYGFHGCSGLSSVTIPASVQTIGDFAFAGCDYLTNIFFNGNAPAQGNMIFAPSSVMLPKTIYYMPGTTGWGTTYAGYPTAPLIWTVSAPTVRAGQLSFSITGPSGVSAVVESTTNLNGATWSPIQTRSLNGRPLFVYDPDWPNHPARFYPVRLQ